MEEEDDSMDEPYDLDEEEEVELELIKEDDDEEVAAVSVASQEENACHLRLVAKQHDDDNTRPIVIL
ncbi:hypothetical protein HDV05_004411, partial [Chytridiales sp. JEL 0842]